MSSVDVVDAQGAKTGTAELPAELFDVTANIPLIHQVVVAQLAAARQGTASTKRRGEVRGGGRKPHRQKGTGRARQGSVRAPQYVGGGVVHGPHPRDYAQRTPKKMIAAALRGALSDRARDGRVYVISDLVSGDNPSTKTALAALARVATTDKVLVVIHRDEDLAWLSLRNAPSVHAIAADQLNAYDVLVNDEVVFTATALDAYVAGRVGGKSVKAVASESEVELPAASGSEPSALEPSTPEPSNDELAAASVEESAEPSNANLAAAAASVATEVGSAEIVEPVAETPDLGAAKYGPGSYVGEEPPSGFDIKGNEDSMLFHTTASPYYSRTIAEVWFNSAEAAEAAGFTDVQAEADPEEGADDQ